MLTASPQQKERFDLSDGLIVASVVLVSLLAGGGSVAADRLALRWSSRATVRIGLLLVAITGTAVAFARPSPPMRYRPNRRTGRGGRSRLLRQSLLQRLRW
ncbi:hypothetical protein AB0C34_04995 [Nocardia sp. NPDC049220]|uniref:hypothetical protein n=1 Tax=Nocardia sp. NPDC049220 TaxID=3155273 RepID=UPI00340E850B